MKASFEPDISREMSAIFVAAIILGLAYNRSSPLGVSFTGALASTPAATLANETVALPDSLTSAGSDPALHNETITAVIVSSGPENTALSIHNLPAALPWSEVKSLLAKGEIVLVDGRESAAYEAGHIPGAISLPLQTLAAKIAQFSTQYPKNKPLVVYCASIRCPISHAEAVALAEQYGYQDVREMPGGFAEWRVAEPSAVLATGANP
jgi:rhodanese-related sulfurtransferase